VRPAQRGPDASWPPASAHRALALLCAITALAMSEAAAASSIGKKFHLFIVRNGFPRQNEFDEPFTPLLEKLALRGIDLPVTSTAPAFTYRFNFETGVPERSSESLGPVFVDRAQTVGIHRFDLAVAYLYAGLTDFNGHDFAGLIQAAGKVTEAGRQELSAFSAENFRLDVHQWLLSATYGLSDRWDANLLLPLVFTSLSVAGHGAFISSRAGSVPSFGRFPAEFDEGAFGVGDMLARSKYRFVEGPWVDVAAVLSVRVPTGNTGDFHGLGDTTITPTFVASRVFGAQDVHASLGMECNTDALERSRLHYGIGIALQPWERLAFPLDVIGSSSFVDDDFSIRAPRGRNFPQQRLGAEEIIRTIGRREIDLFVPRSDIIDLALGAKLDVVSTLTAYAGVIVPLTTDGLRASVIPTAELEFSF
jgi:hypothetical protein